MTRKELMDEMARVIQRFQCELLIVLSDNGIEPYPLLGHLDREAEEVLAKYRKLR